MDSEDQHISQFLENHKELFNDVDNKLKCLICKNILINPYISVCECTFCQRCLFDYGSTNEFCPGQRQECLRTNINGPDDVFPNNLARVKINRLIVKCPKVNCDYEDILSKVVEHQLNCFDKVDCPLKDFGCTVDKVDSIHLDNHILENIGNHSSMIIKSYTGLVKNFQTLTEEFEEIKNINDNLKEENCNIKKENNEIINNLKILKETCETIIKENDDIRKENNELRKISDDIKMENEEIKKEFIAIKNECENIKNYFSNVMNLNVDTEGEKFRDIKEENEKFIKNMHDLDSDIEDNIDSEDENNDNIEGASKIYFGNATEVDEVIDFENEDTKNSNVISVKNELVLNLSNNTFFEWRIKNIKSLKRRNQLIHSPNFYTNLKYRMKMEANFGGDGEYKGSYLSVFCKFICGNFDDNLTWPCNNGVVLGLKNLYTEEYRLIKLFKMPRKCKKRPILNEYRQGRGYSNFFSFKNLFRSEYYKNDEICIVLKLENYF